MAVTASRRLLSTLICLCYVLSSVHLPRAASLSFSFNFSDPDSGCTVPNPDLACSGDADFHRTENAVELTRNVMGGSNNNNYSVGRLTYLHPVPLWDGNGTDGTLASFTTSFTFRIMPAYRNSPYPSADGMAC